MAQAIVYVRQESVWLSILANHQLLYHYGPCAFVTHSAFAKSYVLAISAMVYEIFVKSITITKNIQFLQCLSEI